MKKLLAIPLLTILTLSLQAQTLDEWFRQKQTQKEYLVQQIAALQAYSGTLGQGYALIRQGISAVHSIKNGDLGLHQDFFSSLRQVNPVIGQAKQVTDIIAWQAAILRDFNNTRRVLQQSRLLTQPELEHLEQMKTKALENCARDLELLWLILTAGALELSDDERLRQVNEVHRRMFSTYQLTLAFLKDAQVLALQRAKEHRSLEDLKRLHGLF